MRFSERLGFKPVRLVIQIDSMDDALRNSLWNALVEKYWSQTSMQAGTNDTYVGSTKSLCKVLWTDYFKWQIDTLNKSWFTTFRQIKEYFFKCQWFEVYEFVEFVASNYLGDQTNAQFIYSCNRILEREMSGYRFVGKIISPLTSDEEIATIEAALKSNDPAHPITDHLTRALDLLADRQSPDYRNSMKESISAVEAICKTIASEPKATLGDALTKISIGKKFELHPKLRTAFSNLFDYTNDAQGIRHALTEEPNLGLEDARFMLVACSAFVNYLRVKASKASITT